MTIQAEIKIIIEADHYDYYGLRVIYAEINAYNIGDQLPESKEWIDGEETETVLNGTCAIEVSVDNIEQAIIATNNYSGSTMMLISGNDANCGEDEGEIIIERAILMGQWAK